MDPYPVNSHYTRIEINMSRTVFFLLVVVTVLSTVCGLPSKDDCKKCGKNEVWTDCGSLCPPSCDPKKPKICPDICVKGCQCKHGFLRNNRNECVLPCQCDC